MGGDCYNLGTRSKRSISRYRRASKRFTRPALDLVKCPAPNSPNRSLHWTGSPPSPSANRGIRAAQAVMDGCGSPASPVPRRHHQPGCNFLDTSPTRRRVTPTPLLVNVQQVVIADNWFKDIFSRIVPINCVEPRPCRWYERERPFWQTSQHFPGVYHWDGLSSRKNASDRSVADEELP